MWRELPKSGLPKPKLDAFDLEAEAEGNAIKNGPKPIGPVGKRIAKIRREHDRGGAIANNRSLRNIEIK